MKQTNKLRRIKLDVNTESVKVLTAEELGNVQGGQARTTFSCGVNLCISINAC